MRITPENLVASIASLPRGRAYNYINPKNRGLILVDSIVTPSGPIYIKRYDPTDGQGPAEAKRESISPEMIQRVALAIREGLPINIDRIVGASYNTRSVLESLLAHTPSFHYCYPGRIEVIASSSAVARGHKHLLWLPNTPHQEGVISLKETKMVISELPTQQAVYEAITLPELATASTEAEIEARRLHIRIQYALTKIASGFKCRAYVAKNDQGVQVGSEVLGTLPNVVRDLSSENLFTAYPEAAASASLIDIMWLRNGRFMPAVIEVEHTTGVTSGLSRMLNFKNKFIPIDTRFVIAAPDEDKDKVFTECNKEQFMDLKPKFLPFSAVHELYSMKQRGRLKNCQEQFFDNFLIDTAA